MFCPKCGNEIPDQAKFCPKCGTAVSRPGSGTPDGAAPADPVSSARQSRQARAEAAKAAAKAAAATAKEKAAVATEKTKAAAAVAKEKAAVATEKTRAAAATAKEKAAVATEKTKAAAATAKEKATAATEKIPSRKKKRILIAAALVVAVVLLLAILPGSPKDADSRDVASSRGGIEDGSGVTDDNGTADDGDGAAAGIQRDFSDESDVYRENYQYVIDHQNEIIALYWQGYDERLMASFKGTIEGVYEVVNELDPEFFDYAAASVAIDNADSLLEAHLIDKGIRTYFSDSELGRGLRDITENLLLYAIFSSSSSEDDLIPKDELIYCGGNPDYTLMQTRGNINEINGQMLIDSGYNAATQALDWYSGELSKYHEQNITEEQNIYMNGLDGWEEVWDKWSAIRGRLAALEDCKQAWVDSHMRWVEAFLSDVGLDIDTVTQTDRAKHIYCIFDKEGNQHGVFTALDLKNLTVLDDGSCVYQEGTYDDTALVKRDIDGNLLCSYSGVDMNNRALADGEYQYYPIAPCGNVLRRTTASDFDHGSYDVVELAYPDGSSKEVLQGKNIGLFPYYADPFYHGYGNGSYQAGDQYSSDMFSAEYRPLDGGRSIIVLIDMRTGEIHESSGHGNVSQVRAVSGKYTAGRNGLYETDNPDNVVADLSAGDGPSRVFHSEITDQYWVISNSGYYYALDGDFKQIHEPVQLTKEVYDLCPFGIILYEEDGSLGLYDVAGKQITAFPKADVRGFVAGNVNILTGEQLYLDLSVN